MGFNFQVPCHFGRDMACRVRQNCWVRPDNKNVISNCIVWEKDHTEKKSSWIQDLLETWDKIE